MDFSFVSLTEADNHVRSKFASLQTVTLLQLKQILMLPVRKELYRSHVLNRRSPSSHLPFLSSSPFPKGERLPLRTNYVGRCIYRFFAAFLKLSARYVAALPLTRSHLCVSPSIHDV